MWPQLTPSGWPDSLLSLVAVSLGEHDNVSWQHNTHMDHIRAKTTVVWIAGYVPQSNVMSR